MHVTPAAAAACDASDVVLDRDRVAGVLAELVESELVDAGVGFGLLTESAVDDEVEHLGADVRLQSRQERVDVALRGGGDEAELVVVALGLVHGGDDTGARRQTSDVPRQFLEDLGLLGVHRGGVDVLAAGLRRSPRSAARRRWNPSIEA